MAHNTKSTLTHYKENNDVSMMIRIIKNGTLLIEVLKAIRIHHWVKNTLVFLPVLTGHLANFENLSILLVLFLSLSFTASGMYLINDLLDIENDRKHPTKKFRAIASGSLSPKTAKVISILLITMGLLGSFVTSFYGGILIFLYIVLVGVYSLYIKRIPFFEAFFLTFIYLLRIYMGLLVIDYKSMSLSAIIFSFFFFFFLVLVKRYTELSLYLQSTQKNPTGRGYKIEDLNLIQYLSVPCAITSLVVVGLYISSPKIQALYSAPVYLWGIILLGFLWILNLLIITNKGEMEEDPIVFAFTDRISLLIFLLSLILVTLSI